jgi:hypothetical protein
MKIRWFKTKAHWEKERTRKRVRLLKLTLWCQWAKDLKQLRYVRDLVVVEHYDQPTYDMLAELLNRRQEQLYGLMFPLLRPSTKPYSITCLITLLLLLFFASCTKTVVGPAGANGVSNESIITNTPAWDSGCGYFLAAITDAAITSPTAVDVQVSVTMDGSIYTPLPVSSYAYLGDYLYFNYGKDGVYIYYSCPNRPKNFSFKVDVIPQ